MTFISKLLDTVYAKYSIDTPIIFILPSRRAAVFLKRTLQEKYANSTFFLPKIYDIDTFMGELSQLERIDKMDLLFEFYAIYKSRTEKSKIESFDKFISWASVLLQDFNDMDAYLVAIDKVFSHIEDIKRIESWQVDGEDTALVSRYKSFWKEIRYYYKALEKTLLEANKGYQGLQYREAIRNLEYFKPKEKLIFAGFNALTKAEEIVIQHLLNEEAEIYWDIDKRVFKDFNQESGFFIRKYIQNWNYYKNNKPNWLFDNFSKTNKRKIEIIGASKQLGQAQYINKLLEKNQSINEKTAIILNDEATLNPVLNSLTNISSINITMGFPINYSSYGNLFDVLFKLYDNGLKYGSEKKFKFYYKDVIYLLSNPLIQKIINQELVNETIHIIHKNNWVFLGEKQLLKLFPKLENIHYLFDNKAVNPQNAIANCQVLIKQLHDDTTSLNNEYLLHFYKLFNKLEILNNNYQFLTDIKILYAFYHQLLSQETIDLQGEPLQGLQLMGMLETRVLDFDTVILSSVNEGVLPSGQSNNSFIPFEVRITNELPTYQERDAIFSYHFFRLLYRAKNIHLIYNIEQDVFGSGEQSRFLLQLKNEWQDVFDITEKIVTPQLITQPKKTIKIDKNKAIFNRLKTIANDGFSPSSLGSYIRNPLDFYYKKVLKIREENTVDEEVAANTFGTIVHNTLEELYKPYIDTVLSVDIMKIMLTKVENTIAKYFVLEYKNEDYKFGKNKIAFEVAKKYIRDFIQKERAFIKAGNSIIIRHLEDEFIADFDYKTVDFPIKIKGIIDRIDEVNGQTRIIDYKTGSVNASDLSIGNWELLLKENKAKAFQVLTYAYLVQFGNHIKRDDERNIIATFPSKIKLPFEVGVLSFKNQQAGFMPFYYSEKRGQKETVINKDFIVNYKQQLTLLLEEIFDSSISFEEEINRD
jgi:hypothetical protein